MKIIIMGYSGSGKSTLAKLLANHYQIPLLHLDTLRFQPNWKVTSDQDFSAKLSHFMATYDDWVIEGNYKQILFSERLQAADKIIILQLPRLTCLMRAYRRYLTYRGTTRDSMAEGCSEKFDWEFIQWILIDGRRPSIKKTYQAICNTYPNKTVVLTSQTAIDTLKSELLTDNT